MKNIYIVIHEDVVLSAAAAPLDIFSRTNDLLLASGKQPAFKVKLVGAGMRNVQLQSPAQFICHCEMQDIPAIGPGHSQENFSRALIVLPSIGQAWDALREKHKAITQWLLAHHRAGNEIASLCTGSYFLAEAGLLNGRACTTHWTAMEDMRNRFPNIDFQPDAVVTDHDGIYTGGGAYSSLNMLLYLVEKFCGHEVGVQVAKHFSIHPDHISQAHFSVFRGLNQHNDEAILNAQALIEKQFDSDISVEQLAERVHMSKRNFVRRFKQATGATPLEYIQRVKIEVAKKALENNSRNIQSLMHEVGYNDSKTFREVFRRITGLTPQDYRMKYARA